LVTEVTWEEHIGNSLVVREPVGVVGAITPWNYPLHQITCKLAPALAAGCTVVIKPSELSPLVAYLLIDAVVEAGFPAGVVNLVPGHATTSGKHSVVTTASTRSASPAPCGPAPGWPNWLPATSRA